MENTDHLAPLLQTPGVHGVFVASGGRLIDGKLPPFIPAVVAQNAAQRVDMLFGMVREELVEAGEFLLCFDGYGVFLKRRDAITLAAIVEPECNGEALRMAANLVLRSASLGVPSVGSVPSAPAQVAAGRAAPPEPRERAYPAEPGERTVKKHDIWG